MNNFPANFNKNAQIEAINKKRAVELLSSKWMLNRKQQKQCKLDACYLVISPMNAMIKNMKIIYHLYSVIEYMEFIHRDKKFKVKFENYPDSVEQRKLLCENKKLLISCRVSRAYGNYAIIRNPLTMPRNAHELEVIG